MTPSNDRLAHHRVITPGAVERIEIEYDKAGVCTDTERSDQIFVRARLLDSNGTTVAVSDREIEFGASGRFEIVGPTKLIIEAGIATVLVQVTQVAARRTFPPAAVRNGTPQRIASRAIARHSSGLGERRLAFAAAVLYIIIQISLLSAKDGSD